MKKITVVAGLLLLSATAYSQSIQRQSVGTVGSSSSSEGVTIQQSIGQPYQTKAHYSNQGETRPGFIQPTQVLVEFVSSTFEVEVDVYPNPSSDYVFFKSNENMENITLVVFDQGGRQVLSESVESLRQHRLDCTNFEAGNYILLLQDKDQVYKSKLIITK